MSPRRPSLDIDWRPTPPEIEQAAPEIAQLSVLQRTFDVTVYAVLAIHPYLAADQPGHFPLHLSDVKAADAGLAHAHRLRDALDRYSQAIADLHRNTPCCEADPPSADHPDGLGDADYIPF